MAQASKIEWTDATWNPTRGCSRVSEGCRNCYAERQAMRFAKSDLENKNQGDQPFHGFVHLVNGHPAWTGKVELVENHLADPLRWRKPRRIFVNSMSDIFHEAVPEEALLWIFLVMGNTHIATGCEQTHTLQVLTKRENRMLDFCTRLRWRTGIAILEIGGRPSMVNHMPYLDTCDPWVSIPGSGPQKPSEKPAGWMPPQLWLGVSVENQETAAARIPRLLQAPAAVRFVSYEPALGPVDFEPYLIPCDADLARDVDLDSGWERGLDQIIVGGESGPGARPFDMAWARETIQQCKAAGVAVFVKQLGARPILTGTWSKDTIGDWNPRVYPYRSEDGTIKGFEAQLRDPKGGDMSEWPEDLRVREFPEAA